MASSATTYLLELMEEGGDDAMDFWAAVSEIAGATITAFSTEVPEWLKQAAAEQLQTVFGYDYWLNVGETTREAVRATIERGINDGLPIREVADLIQEERGEDYARYRAVNTARTETNNALNRGASSAIETLEQETGLEMQKEWMSQYSTTTRPNHAAMDGQVSVGPNKLFAFIAQDGNTYNIPEPGDPSLPAEDRCQCGCGILSSFVGEEVDRSDLDAVREELLATDAPTLIGMERSHHHHGTKYSEDQPRDDAGRFGSGSGSGSDVAFESTMTPEENQAFIDFLLGGQTAPASKPETQSQEKTTAKQKEALSAVEKLTSTSEMSGFDADRRAVVLAGFDSKLESMAGPASDETKEQIKEAVHAAATLVPNSMLSLAGTAISKYTAYDSYSQLNEAVNVPKGLVASGGYDPASQSIHATPLSTDVGIGTALHEIGHAYDYHNVRVGGKPISKTDAWVKQWKAEIDKDGSPLSDYARTGPDEGFAEWFRSLCTNPRETAKTLPGATLAVLKKEYMR